MSSGFKNLQKPFWKRFFDPPCLEEIDDKVKVLLARGQRNGCAPPEVHGRNNPNIFSLGPRASKRLRKKRCASCSLLHRQNESVGNIQELCHTE